MKSPPSHHKIGALDWLCLRAIAWYQRAVSPRKCYRCAYSRLYGGAGCSGFARDAIVVYGLREALPLVRARFEDCKKAGQALRAQTAMHRTKSAEGAATKAALRKPIGAIARPSNFAM